MTRLTPESPAGHTPAGLFPFTTPADESPDRPLPREHDANGHYAIGPKLRKPGLVTLIREELEAFAPVRERAPVAERRQLAKRATRAAAERRSTRLARAVAGEFTPVRARRSA